MKVILYTTHCPKCEVLEAKLKSKKVEYDCVTDTQEMLKLGMASAPNLSVDGNIMDFSQAVTWVNALEVD